MAKKTATFRAKSHNIKLVFKTIYSHGLISRADVARVTQLTPPTVSAVASRLIQEGIVEEVGLAPSSGGRRAILLRVVDDSHYLIGLDLSRQDFRGVLSNLRGTIKYRLDLPLEGRDGEAALGILYELVDSLVSASNKPILGIGIGVPGLVDSSRGVLQQSVNLNWRHIPFRSMLQERYHLPVFIANDSQAAALAVYTFGPRTEAATPLVVINLGRGVGAGIVLNGQLFHGHPVGAGEIGHVKICQDGVQCACGHYGCLETIASSRGIERQVREILDQNSRSTLHDFITDPEHIDLDEVIQAFFAGNEEIREVILGVGKALGVTAAHLVGILGSCRILLGGSVAGFGQFLLDSMREEMADRTLSSLARDTEVGIAEIGADMVIHGASALILHYELGVL